jgi:cell shape-determining protein MreD
MKHKLLLATNLLLFALATLLLGTVQTSLWFEIFGYFPAPAFWMPCLVYVALFRSTIETVIYAYLVAFLLATLTAIPEGTLMVVCLAVALSVQVFKQRIYWSESTYFMLICGIASLLFNVYHMASTFFIGNAALTSPQISDWLIQALLTPLIAPGLMPIFRWIDRITQREQPPEVSTQVP